MLQHLTLDHYSEYEPCRFGNMDLDLTEYDQVDEARFFISSRMGVDGHDPADPSSLVVTLSSSSEQACGSDDANCENDFVFLPPESIEQQSKQATPKARHAINPRNQPDADDRNTDEVARIGQKLNSPSCIRHPTSLPITGQDDAVSNLQAAARASHPLMTINPNASSSMKNPFYNLHQIGPDSVSGQSYQPFWIRPENLASKPIGLLEINSTNSCSPGHLSDLMHQIITKSDSIYITIPCAYCHEPKACPPSDISAWVNHMNRSHNCKVCPICNKLVGLGPMRDIEIMKRHVVSHIDDEWLERRSARTNFSFGLQQQWFSGGRCNVTNPRNISNNSNRK